MRDQEEDRNYRATERPRRDFGTARREEEDQEPPRKAPWPLRLLAWGALVAIFFAVGYGATSLVFQWLDAKGTRADQTVANSREAQELVSQDQERPEQGQVTFTLSVPAGEAFENRSIQVLGGGLVEEDLKKVLDAYMTELKSSGWMADQVPIRHLFRSGEWLYLDLGSSFAGGLKALDPKRAGLVMTGLVKTVGDNFAPLRKVKVYVEGREAPDRKPLDLSKPWVLKS